MSAKLTAFLALIGKSEGTSTNPLSRNRGYDVVVTGDVKAGEVGQEVFNDWEFHPFEHGRAPKIVRTMPSRLESTASGRYQIRLATWLGLKKALGLVSFLPIAQDLGAIELIRQRGALDLVESGRIQAAIAACAPEWASFPGAGYNQPEEQFSKLLHWFGDLYQPQGQSPISGSTDHA